MASIEPAPLTTTCRSCSAQGRYLRIMKEVPGLRPGYVMDVLFCTLCGWIR